MENQTRYFKSSPTKNNKLFSIPKLRILIITLLWLAFLYVLLLEWLYSYPRIIEIKTNSQNIFDENKQFQFRIESQAMQNIDNILIITYQQEKTDDLKYVQFNSKEILSIPPSLIKISICNSRLHNVTCASDEQISEVLNKIIDINFIFHLEVYNYLDSEIETIQKSIKFFIHKNNTLNGFFSFEANQFNIQKQFQQQQFTLTSDIDFSATSLGLSTLNLASLQLQYDQIMIKKTIIYDSVVQLFLQELTITFVCFYLNKFVLCLQKMKKESKNQLKVLSYYFPELSNYNIYLNCFGKIVDVQVKSQDIDTKSVKWIRQFVNRYIKSVKQKFKIKNLIYQISRLQFICQSMQQRELIMYSHKVGIKLKFQDEVQNETLSNFELIDNEDSEILKCQDIDLLNVQNGPILIGDCQNSFYKRNQIEMMNKKFWLI